MNNQSYRNITIVYSGISRDCQVQCSQIVGHYFEKRFKDEHNDFFITISEGKQEKTTSLKELESFDVRLNSKDDEKSSVKGAQHDFWVYNPTKRLTFYILPKNNLEGAVFKNKEQDQAIEFQYLSGGSCLRSINLDIKGKTYPEVQLMLRQSLGIESSQMVQFIQLPPANRVIAVDRSQEPFRRFRSQGLSKVGIKKIYTNG